jgi:hypothetical protein
VEAIDGKPDACTEPMIVAQHVRSGFPDTYFGPWRRCPGPRSLRALGRQPRRRRLRCPRGARHVQSRAGERNGSCLTSRRLAAMGQSGRSKDARLLPAFSRTAVGDFARTARSFQRQSDSNKPGLACGGTKITGPPSRSTGGNGCGGLRTASAFAGVTFRRRPLGLGGGMLKVGC